MSDKKKILLIEDDPDHRDLWTGVLGDKLPHCSIKHAVNYVDGCGAAADDPSIVAVITDNNMPRDSSNAATSPQALRICQQLRRMPHLAKVPIFVASTEMSPADKAALERMGIPVSEKMPDDMEAVATRLRGLLAPETLPPDHRSLGTSTGSSRGTPR